MEQLEISCLIETFGSNLHRINNRGSWQIENGICWWNRPCGWVKTTFLDNKRFHSDYGNVTEFLSASSTSRYAASIKVSQSDGWSVITGGNNNEFGRQCQTFHSRSVGSGESWWQTSIMNAMNSQIAELRHICAASFHRWPHVCVCTIDADTKHNMNTFYGTAVFIQLPPPTSPPPHLPAVAVETVAEQERTILLLLGGTIPSIFLQQTNQ